MPCLWWISVNVQKCPAHLNYSCMGVKNEYTINNQASQHLIEMNGITVQREAVLLFWMGANNVYICGSFHTLQSATIARLRVYLFSAAH